MHSFSKIFFWFLLLTVMISCKKESCLQSAGKIIAIEKNLSSFKSVQVNDNINLILVQGNEEKIKIETGENLQPYIISEIESGGKLSIKNTIKCSWLRDPSELVNVYVYFKNINQLNYHSYGNVSSNAITADEFTLTSNGGAGLVNLNINTNKIFINNNSSADFILKGTSNYCEAFTNYRGTLNLKDLSVRKMNIDFWSVFNGHINVTDTLSGTVGFKGNLYYSGNPSLINVTTTNKGRLLPL